MTKKVWKKVLVRLGDSDIQVYKIKTYSGEIYHQDLCKEISVLSCDGSGLVIKVYFYNDKSEEKRIERNQIKFILLENKETLRVVRTRSKVLLLY
jgi:hypothetical protein